MAKFTPYTVAALPTTGIDVDGLYFVKGASETRFKIYIRKKDNSDWVSLGTADSVDSVNGLIGAVQIELSLNSSTGVLSLTGGTQTINLDARFDKKTDNIAWARITGAPGFALDADVVHKAGTETITGDKTFSKPVSVAAATASGHAVNKGQLDAVDGNAVHRTGAESIAGVKTFTDKPIVPAPTASGEAANKGYVDGLDANAVHKTGNETIAGTKTFSSAPIVPAGTANNHAVNKGQMDTADANLQTQINNISTTLSSGIKIKGDIDVSTNPNYPAAVVGDAYIAINAPGKIGGASGVLIERNGSLIVCKANSAAGNQATVGANWTILENDLDQATETVMGIVALASQAKVDAGTDAESAVTPKTLQKKLNDLDASADGKYVRYDAAQTITSGQKTIARSNIDAADDSAVVKLTGNQSIAGTKTFSTIPVLPATSPTSDNQAARKKYVDDSVSDAVAWGARDW